MTEVVVLAWGSSGVQIRGDDGALPPPASGTVGRRRRRSLDERYARGQLADEEYQGRLQQLRGDTNQ